MLPIGKKDLVILPDFEEGMVLDIIIAEGIRVFKIQKIKDNNIIYVEAKRVLLEKQSTVNYALTCFLEVINFLMYTFNIW
jgi:hypothetical protein